MHNGPIDALYPDLLGLLADHLDKKDEVVSFSQVSKPIRYAILKRALQRKKLYQHQIDIHFPYLKIQKPLSYTENPETLYKAQLEKLKKRYEDDYWEKRGQAILAAMAGEFFDLNTNFDDKTIHKLYQIALSNGHFAGASKISSSRKGRAFEYAAEDGNVEAVKALLQRLGEHITTENKCDALNMAFKNGHYEVVAQIVENTRYNFDENPYIFEEIRRYLEKVFRKKNIPALKMLINLIDPDDADGCALLREILPWAILNEHIDIVKAIRSKNVMPNNFIDKMMSYFLERNMLENIRLTFLFSLLSLPLYGVGYFVKNYGFGITASTFALQSVLICASVGLIIVGAAFLFVPNIFRKNAYEEYSVKSNDQIDRLSTNQRAAFLQGMRSVENPKEQLKSWTVSYAALRHPKAWAAGLVSKQHNDEQLIHKVKYAKI